MSQSKENELMAWLQCIVIVVLICIASGCASTSPAVKKETRKSYTVMGKTYYPLKEVQPGFAQTGTASWYGPGFHGKKTASGEVYNMHELSAAHSTLPLNSIVRVTNMLNNKEIVLRVNDRGPFVGDRIIDLSLGAAKELAMLKPGVVPVKVVVIGRADSRIASRDKPRSVSTAKASPPNPFYAAKSSGLMAFIFDR